MYTHSVAQGETHGYYSVEQSYSIIADNNYKY